MKQLITILFLLTGLFSLAQGNLDINPCLYPFYHGVASGDPMSDRVIIWTRVTPDSLDDAPVIVKWKVAKDTGMTDVIHNGSLITNSDKDYTVKIDVTELNPETYYYYEFEALGYRSATGRTKTAPANDNADTVRFGIVSCANLEAGYFNVYGAMNERNDLDAVICLGDYIYEYETGGYSPNPETERFWEPNDEITTLADYRMRYSTYHLDKDLQHNHQIYPWICIWDDHELANDAWKNGAENHTEGTEGIWSERKDIAKQAYFEWLPIRETGETDPYQLYRSIHYGGLCDLIMLDTRVHGRDEQAGTSGAEVESEFREMLGPDQREWMNDALMNGEGQWKILAQQVMVAPLEIAGIALNGDQWDGYPAERNRLYDFVRDHDVENLVVITGDIHTSWANDLPGETYSPGTGAGAIGVEFVAPSVTSPGFPIDPGPEVIQISNPHMKYIDLTKHGFIVLDINEERAQADWFYINTIDEISNDYYHGASWFVTDNTAHLQESISAAIPSDDLTESVIPEVCPRTSEDPIDPVDDASIEEKNMTVLALFPNPANDYFTIQYFLQDKGDITLNIRAMDGKSIKSFTTKKTNGLWVERYPLEDVQPGIYLIELNLNGQRTTHKLIVK